MFKVPKDKFITTHSGHSEQCICEMCTCGRHHCVVKDSQNISTSNIQETITSNDETGELYNISFLDVNNE